MMRENVIQNKIIEGADITDDQINKLTAVEAKILQMRQQQNILQKINMNKSLIDNTKNTLKEK